MLGLTSRAANAHRSFWSKETILTALPFLPRRFLQPRARRFQPLAQRTTTPLLVSVLSVLQLLTSGPNALTVEVVRNVSREYADFLHQTVDDLENDPAVRAAFVREWGMQGWIEEKLCLAWEAALVDAGMLENWVIVVCKAE
uniref:Rab/GTPase n=1 Tax=Ganoderma boninense TaxID=34458 RepID=A0A5K1K399_9APHY|nr:Putative Rab/GTPase [Ganoderma boninense]